MDSKNECFSEKCVEEFSEYKKEIEEINRIFDEGIEKIKKTSTNQKNPIFKLIIFKHTIKEYSKITKKIRTCFYKKCKKQISDELNKYKEEIEKYKKKIYSKEISDFLKKLFNEIETKEKEFTGGFKRLSKKSKQKILKKKKKTINNFLEKNGNLIKYLKKKKTKKNKKL